MGFQAGLVQFFFAYISTKTFRPVMGAVLYGSAIYQQGRKGLTAVEIYENGPKWLIALRKVIFLYVYPVFKLLIYKGKPRGAILRPYPIRWHRFVKVALRTRLRASERQLRFVKHFFLFIARGDTLPLYM